MKKILALLLTVALVFAMTASCFCTTACADEKEPKHWVLGMPDMRANSADPTWGSLIANIELIAEKCNGEIVYLSGIISTAEGAVQCVDEAIAQGCDGVFIMPVTDAVMPVISQKCQEAGIYFASWFRKIQNPEILAMLENNPYWCGWTIEAEFEEGFLETEYLANLGVKQIAFYGQEVGDACSDMREEGMRAACEQYGIEVVAEVRNLGSTAEITQAFESCIASYPDLDGLVMLSSYVTNATEAMAEAIATAGKTGQIRLAALDTTMSQGDLFAAGKLDISGGCQHIINTVMTACSVLNFVMGTPLDPDGKPNYTEDAYIYTHTKEEIDEAFSLYGGLDGSVIVFGENTLKDKLLKFYNPELTQEDFYSISRNWGLEELRELHEYQ